MDDFIDSYKIGRFGLICPFSTYIEQKVTYYQYFGIKFVTVN